MLDPIKQTILYDYNAIYYGYPIEKLMEKAGKGIADFLIKKYGKGLKIGFFCGLGNNGGDGFVAARYLLKNSKPEIYLTGDSKKIRTPEAKKNWERFKGVKHRQGSALAGTANHFDIVVECLFGTGIQGKLKEPYYSVIKKLNRLKGKKVAVDFPAPGFKPDFVISMMTEKVPGAAVVDIGYPKWLKEKIGIGEVKSLHKPTERSHKGDNGKLLIIGGSKMYHGAPFLTAKIASKIVDLVYFSSIPENNELIKKMKSRLCEFITVSRNEVFNFVKKVDTVLIGPGMGVSEETKTITNQLLKRFKNKKFVLDADALRVVDKKLLNKNCIITPHREEFKSLFPSTRLLARQAGSRQVVLKKAVFKMAKKYKCIIVLKGTKDYVSDGNELKVNTTGNAGMTKGGTGDVLAGLIAALACKNDLFLAASAGVFINGLAGDRLKKKVFHCYNASDLINEIPKTIKWCEDFKKDLPKVR